MGAIAVTITRQTVFGDMRCTYGTFTMSSSYAAGGDTFTPQQFGMNSLQHIEIAGGQAITATPTAFDVVPNIALTKMIALGTNATPGAAVAEVEVTAATNLSGFTAAFMAWGN